jgi:hypothetical protein
VVEFDEFFYEKELTEEKVKWEVMLCFCNEKLTDGKSNWKVIFLMKRTHRWVRVRQDCQTHKLLSFPVLHTTKETILGVKQKILFKLSLQNIGNLFTIFHKILRKLFNFSKS